MSLELITKLIYGVGFGSDLFPADAAELRDGGDPELAGGEADGLAELVAEDDLAFLGGFLPTALDDAAVLENVSAAGIDSADLLVVAVGHGSLLDHHGDDCARRDLGELATFGEGVGLIEAGRAVVDEVGVAALVRAEIGIGGGVVNVAGVVVEITAKVDADSAGGVDF